MSDDLEQSNVSAGVPAPRANPDLLGHERAERLLRDAFDAGRLAHAWLLCGPRGIGKATLAYRFARYVLAASSRARSPQSQAGLFGDAAPAALDTDLLHVPEDHPVFQRVAGGGHADLLGIERRLDDKGEKRRAEIVVDDVRPIAHFLSLTAAEGGWRVIVVDTADDMNRSAANALLKVLEEPPSKALLLLVSNNPGRLLPTIRSRCRRLMLSALEADVLQTLLRRYHPDLAPDEVAALTRLAEGSIGRALDLAAEGGVVLYREFIGLVSGLPDLDIKGLHAFGDKLTRSGQDAAFRTFAELAQGWMQRLMVRMARRGGSAGEAIGAEEGALQERLIAHGHLGAWLAAWDHADHILGRAETAYLDKKQVALSLFHALEKASLAA
ncbi:MAG: DNA polymerase III subunit delta' [Rhodospirillales bacterium]